MINKFKKDKQNIPDLQIKKINFGLNKLYILNIQTLSSSQLSNQYIMQYLSQRSLLKTNFSSIKKDINNFIPSISFIEVDYDQDKIYEYLFNGFTILIYKKEVLAFETRATLDRGVNTPVSEPAIKGPKDSFNENYNTNLGLIRKRIKNKNLYIKELTLGTKTKTKICVFYMNDIVDKELLNYTIQKLKNIKADKILDTYYIKELIKKENKTTFPTIKSTEKPDTIAKCLTEGKICILTENSDNALIIPTFFVDFFYLEEDNYNKKFYSEFIKILRIIAFFITIFAPSIYLSLITYDQQMLPTSLLVNFTLQRYTVPFPALIEALLLLFTFELLYEADALKPSSRGTSLSILGALVLGDAAVSAGIISPIMVIIVAITALCSMFFSYHEFQSFIRIYRYSLMIASSFLGIIGILFGFIILLTNLCSIKSFEKPFLIPLSPTINENKKNKINKALLPQNTNKGEL